MWLLFAVVGHADLDDDGSFFHGDFKMGYIVLGMTCQCMFFLEEAQEAVSHVFVAHGQGLSPHPRWMIVLDFTALPSPGVPSSLLPIRQLQKHKQNIQVGDPGDTALPIDV